MSLHILPRYAVPAAIGTREAIQAAERPLTIDVRRRAVAALQAAMRRGRLRPEAVAAAAEQGDVAIADLMRSHAVALHSPALDPAHIPPPPCRKPDPATVAALHPWIRLLAAEGHLPAEGLQHLSAPTLSMATLCRVLAIAWNRKKQALLASIDVPALLDENHPALFDCLPQPFLQLLGNDAGPDAGPVPTLTVFNRDLTHVAVRATGDDALAIEGALRELVKQMQLPLVGDPSYAIEDIHPGLDELFSDLEAIATWGEDGEPSLPLDELTTMLEEFGWDASSEGEMRELREHLKWRRWRDQTSLFPVGSGTAQAWLDAQGDSRLAQVYREIVRITTLLATLPALKHTLDSDGYAGTGYVTLVPTATGMDDWIEQTINDIYNSGEVESETRVSLTAKPAQLGSSCDRALTEVAVANYIASLIATLD